MRPIDKKKESLEASKDEADYQRTQAKKLREIAKLQARIDVLSLDNSREAQAEKAKLLEEMAELQDELAQDQADKSLEAAENALDEMEAAYHEEKDKEIAILDDSISSYQKLYDMAISYIQSNWDTLYSELINYNMQYGDVLSSEIASSWDNCLAAAQRYGSYVSALNNIDADIESSQGGNNSNSQVGETNYESGFSREDDIHATIKEMYQNAQLWHSASQSQRQYLDSRNLDLGEHLRELGIDAHRENGTWYDGNELLFEKYKEYTYHKGGFAGDTGTLKDNEILAKLEKGESVLTARMWDNLTAMFDRMSRMSASIGELPLSVRQAALDDTLKRVSGGAVTNVTNSSQPVEIRMGDITVYAPSGDGKIIADEVQNITQKNMEQITRYLRIKL